MKDFDFESILPALGSKIYLDGKVAYLQSYDPDSRKLLIVTETSKEYLTFSELSTRCKTISQTTFMR